MIGNELACRRIVINDEHTIAESPGLVLKVRGCECSALEAACSFGRQADDESRTFAEFARNAESTSPSIMRQSRRVIARPRPVPP